MLGGEGAWDNVDQTAAQCPNKDCDDGTRAYFFQLQIRSADEPVSSRSHSPKRVFHAIHSD